MLDGTGIHDIHMNQGNSGSFDSAVGSDGAFIIHYPSDGHFEAVFLAFADQAIPTDNQTGKPAQNAQTLQTLAKGNATSSTQQGGAAGGAGS